MAAFTKNQKGGEGKYHSNYQGELGGDLNWMPSDSSTGLPQRDLQPRKGIDVSWIDRDNSFGNQFPGPLPKGRRK